MSGIGWTTPDPLADKYYSVSPYAFCNNNPVNFIDPDGLTPRLYIQKSGIGHAFVTTGEGNNLTIYTYGRYGAISDISGSDSGSLTPKGEGVLVRLTGENALQYMQNVQEEGKFEIYQIEKANDKTVSAYFDVKFRNGSSPTEPTKSSFNNPNAKVIDTYSLLKNNCVTTSLGGINASSTIIKTDVVTPRALARYMNKQSEENSSMINKVISVLIIFLWITALIWNVYSYLCMGVSHEYDIYGIVTTQNSRDMLNVMWKTFSMSVIINSSLIFLAFFEMLLKNNKDRRRWFYIISLMTSTLSVVIWEINYRNLLMTLTDSGDITVNILKRGYYTYIIVIMIITGILLLLEERNAHCRISGNP